MPAWRGRRGHRRGARFAYVVTLWPAGASEVTGSTVARRGERVGVTALGARLRELRLAADLTLEALSERAGLSDRAISDIERGVSAVPRRATVDALALGLGLSEQASKDFLALARSVRRARFEGGGATAPHRINDLAGREDEIAAALTWIDERPSGARACAVVVVSGSPGIGKTTVAWEAISRHAAGRDVALFVDLDGFGMAPLTPFEVLISLLDQLPGDLPAPATSVAEAGRLWRAATEAHPVVVLLDNAASEAQVRPVLAAGPQSVVIVTSRRSLSGLEGAHRIVLGPLARHASIDLLNELIPQEQRDMAAVDGLAAICDDTPLAMRIAGNRIASRPTWRAADFLERLRAEEDRLRLLVAGDLAVETAFSLSYENLEGDTAHLFRGIAVIEGGTFDVRIAAAATSQLDLADVESRLEDLTDLGLLDARGQNRYRMHDLLRLFAMKCLRAEEGPTGVIDHRNRLRRWLLNTLERAGAWYEPDRQESPASASSPFRDSAQASEWIRAEAGHWWPAMQQAAALGENALVVDVADALHWYSDIWVAWGHWTEFFSMAAEAAKKLDDPLLEATHLGYVSWALNVERGDYGGARKVAEAALAAAEQADDDTQRGWAGFYIGWAHLKLEDYEPAKVAIRNAIAAFGRTDDKDGRIIAGSMLATILAAQDLHGEAVAELEGLLRAFDGDEGANSSVSRQVAECTVHGRLSDAYLALQRADDAVDAATRALTIAQHLDDKARMVVSLQRRVKAQVLAGNLSGADRDIAYAREVLGPKQSESHILDLLRDELS